MSFKKSYRTKKHLGNFFLLISFVTINLGLPSVLTATDRPKTVIVKGDCVEMTQGSKANYKIRQVGATKDFLKKHLTSETRSTNPAHVGICRLMADRTEKIRNTSVIEVGDYRNMNRWLFTQSIVKTTKIPGECGIYGLTENYSTYVYRRNPRETGYQVALCADFGVVGQVKTWENKKRE